MSPTETLPLLVAVVLLVSASGGAVDEMRVVYDGDPDVTAVTDVLVVAGGTVTVPSGETVRGSVYVVGGSARIDGRLEGDVTVLAGNLSVADGAAVTGTLQTVAGDVSVADGATVGARTTLPVETATGGPLGAYGGLLLQFVVVGLAGWVLSRRRPALLANVGHAVTDRTAVSAAVGALAGATLLVLFVFMAFTLLLLPVSVLGLLAQFAAVLYGYAAFGHLVGRRLPLERPGAATVAGVGVVLVALELVGRVPYLGAVVQFGVVVLGFGAVLLTYFGLRRFHPATVPPARPGGEG